MAVQIAEHQTPSLQRWKTVSRTDKASAGNNRQHIFFVQPHTVGLGYLGRCNYFIVIILSVIYLWNKHVPVRPARRFTFELQWLSLCLWVEAQSVDLQILCKGSLNDLTKIEAYNRYIFRSYSELRLLIFNSGSLWCRPLRLNERGQFEPCFHPLLC
jgi:hypothetical protein